MATKTKQSGCGTIIIGAIALFFLYKMFSCNNTPDEPEKIDEGKAYSVSHEFVKAKLKSPSTADFPYYNKNFSADLGGSTFMIISYVDCKNVFNATVRTHYTCELKYKYGDWSSPASWELITLVFR